MTISYAVEDGLEADEFVDILKRFGLDKRRPVDKPDVIRAMVENAGLTVTARDENGRLVGVARSVTDFAYCCYLSDLAVDRDCQRQGIGKELMARTKAAAGILVNVHSVLLRKAFVFANFSFSDLDRMNNVLRHHI